jgi:hypothetical protein
MIAIGFTCDIVTVKGLNVIIKVSDNMGCFRHWITRYIKPNRMG